MLFSAVHLFLLLSTFLSSLVYAVPIERATSVGVTICSGLGIKSSNYRDVCRGPPMQPGLVQERLPKIYNFVGSREFLMLWGRISISGWLKQGREPRYNETMVSANTRRKPGLFYRKWPRFWNLMWFLKLSWNPPQLSKLNTPDNWLTRSQMMKENSTGLY